MVLTSVEGRKVSAALQDPYQHFSDFASLNLYSNF